MTEPTTFKEHPWQQSSEPLTIVQVHESDCWPVDDNSVSGTKDDLIDGRHPVIAIGERAAPTRALNITGVVVSCQNATAGASAATDKIQVNVACGVIVRQWVSNILTYSGGAPNTFEQTPQPGQPVYVDDSDDLSAGVTLSMSPNSTAGLDNPLAGYLWYCQDEYMDSDVGGPNTASTFDTTLANEAVEQEYCVLLTQAVGLAA